MEQQTNMNRDGVATAFELIIEEIEAVAADIADQGGQAFHDKAYDIAQQLGESGKNLQEFRIRVESLLEDWQSGIDVVTRQRFLEGQKTRKKTTIAGQSKAAKTRLHVAFTDGTTIEEYYAADTFALALRHFGLTRVEALGLTESGVSLVCNVRSEQYGQRRIDGKYICTHSNTQKKKDVLDKIGKSLGVGITVKIKK
jgi:hypothetical protein